MIRVGSYIIPRWVCKVKHSSLPWKVINSGPKKWSISGAAFSSKFKIRIIHESSKCSSTSNNLTCLENKTSRVTRISAPPFFSFFWRQRLRASARLDPDPEPDPAADLVEPGFENLLHTPITHQGNCALTRAKDTLTPTTSNEKQLSSREY